MYKKILQNSSWLLISQSLTKGVSFFYTIFLARSLGVENFGLYTVAISYFGLLSAVADFGISRYLTREVAIQKNNLALISNVIMLRLTLVSVIFAGFTIVLYLLDPSKLRVSLSLIAVLAIFPQVISMTFDAIYVAFQRLFISALGLIILSLSTSLLGYFLITNNFGAFGAVVAVLIGQFIYAVFLVVLSYIHKNVAHSKITSTVLKQILVGAAPYGVLGIVGLVSFRMDTIVLSYFRGNFEVGIYGAAYKFLDAATFIPVALSTALFPVLARLHTVDSAKMQKLYYRSLGLMLVVGLLVALGYIFILPNIIHYYLPNYLPSINSLIILSMSIPFIFMHIPSGQVLLSSEKYLKQVLILYLMLLTINFVMVIIFIPQFGYIAASWVTVLSEFSTFITFLFFLQRKVFKQT